MANITDVERKSSRCVNKNASTAGNLFPQDKCLLCDKSRKKYLGKVEILYRCLTDNAETSIKEAEKQKNDFVMLGKVTGEDIKAKEARYHNSCRRDYVRINEKYQSKATKESNVEMQSDWKEKRLAYDEAFKFICDHISRHVIASGNVKRLSMLQGVYAIHLR